MVPQIKSKVIQPLLADGAIWGSVMTSKMYANSHLISHHSFWGTQEHVLACHRYGSVNFYSIDNSMSGIVIGVVLSVAVLAVLFVIIVVLLRYRRVKTNKKTVANQLLR